MSLEFWNKVKQPPAGVLRKIEGGRLSGKSDINPMWRYQVMTEEFGMCGIGWKYEIVKLWTEPGPENQVFSCAQINLYFKQGDKWSDPVPSIGGHMLIVKEKGGLHANDEGFKMAITDALGTAMKMLGVAADVYAGIWDGSKYKDEQKNEQKTTQTQKPAQGDPGKVPGSNSWIYKKVIELKIPEAEFLKWMNTELHIPVEANLKDTLLKAKISDENRQKIAQVINMKETSLKGAK